MEVPKENTPTTDVLPEEDAVTMASPSTLGHFWSWVIA